MLTEIADPLCLAFNPPDARELDEWAREHVKVGAWSPWEGDFTTERTPFIVEPLRRLGAHGPRRVTLRGPAAGGKSTVGEVFLAWAIDNAPGFAAWFAQDEDAAKEFAETRVQRFLASCERVSRWFPANRHAKRTQAIHFPHMSFVIQAANQGNAQSKHIRHLICDEPWLYKPGMLAQLHKRTTRFAHNRTILEMSTGSIEGDEFDQAWQQGSRQAWQIRCTACGQHHVPRWSFGRDKPGGVKWDQSAKRADGTWDHRLVADSAGYECPHCLRFYAANAANGYALNSVGRYTEPARDGMPSHWSFHWNCIASDFAQLGAIAVEFLQAKAALKRGTTALLQEFTQKKLAEAWKEEPPEAEFTEIRSDYALGEHWDLAGVPVLRVMVVDVQETHFWALVRDFAKDGRARLVDCARLDSWDSVRSFQDQHNVPRNCVLVDSGDQTDSVYSMCCLHGWFAIKGERVPLGYEVRGANGRSSRVMARYSRDAAGQWVQHFPTKLPAGAVQRWCKLVLVSDERSSQVLDRARKGLVEGWSMPKDAPDFYRGQLASMVRLSRHNKLTNQVEWYWRSVGNAGNHLWDCERYALAAAFLAGYFFLAEPPTEPKKDETEAA